MKNTGNEVLKSLGRLLGEKKENVVIVTHENPDGDAIGSAIGLAEILKNTGWHVTIISPNNYPGFIKWFSSEVEIQVFCNNRKKGKKTIEAADLLICVDFNDAKRAGDVEKSIKNFDRDTVLIDHHPEPTDFVDVMISEPSYSSTAELIFDIVTKIELKDCMNAQAAEALYTGIMTDTGSFSHNISNPNTFRVIAELLEFGIDAEKIQSNVYHNFSASRMKLLGYCLNSKMLVFPELRSAVIHITQKELDDFNYETGDTEGFVNYPLSINNVVFSALFIEKENFVKASFRSKGSFPANKFASEHFNGGGHLNAAGGETNLKLNDAVEKFRQLLDEYKHQLLETII